MNKNKILIVEDEISIRETLRDILFFYGYEVKLAEDGLKAKMILKNWIPDLILCDIMMPNMDGMELLEYVRGNSKYNNVPYIFLTAKKIEDDFRTAMNSGSDDYIVKPFKSSELIKAIENKIKRFKALNIKKEELDFGLNEVVQNILTSPLYALIPSIDLINDDEIFTNKDEKNKFVSLLKQSSFKTLKNLENLFYYKKIINKETIGNDTNCNIQNTILESVQRIRSIFKLNDDQILIDLLFEDESESVSMSRKEVLLVLSEILENSIIHNDSVNIVIKGRVFNKFFKINISDDGKGYNVPETIPNPFNQDTTIEDENLRLGLFISNSLIEYNKGKMDIYSELEKGTNVEIYFPR